MKRNIKKNELCFGGRAMLKTRGEKGNYLQIKSNLSTKQTNKQTKGGKDLTLPFSARTVKSLYRDSRILLRERPEPSSR